MSFVLLHITWDGRQSNHRLACVPGNQSHPGYLKPCLPGPVFCENSWEACHVDRVPVKRQVKAARKVQPLFKYATVLLRLQGKKDWGPGGGSETERASVQSSRGHSAAVGFQLGQGRNVGRFPQHLPALGTSSLPAPHAPRCLWGHGRMFAWETSVVV